MGDWIDLDFCLATIKDATRATPSIAWVGWLFGIVLVGLGAIPPGNLFLLVLGVVLLVGMSANLAWRVKERRECVRIARLPVTAASPNQSARTEVRLHLDVPEHGSDRE